MDAAASRRGKCPGRRPGARVCVSYRGRAQEPVTREGAASGGRRRLRGVIGWRYAPFASLCAPAQVVWSFRNPDCSCALPDRAQASTAETTASGCGRCRGEHEASRKNHRARNAGCVRCFRGDLLVRLFLSRMRLRMHLASGVPCALVKEGSGLKVRARPRRHKNRADDARPQTGAVL